MEVTFSINNKNYSIKPTSVPLDTTLNNFIRNYANLKGTKFMCLEGGCGACIVTLKRIHPTSKKEESWAVNSCLQNIYSCHGLEIITVEGIGSKKIGIHKIQKRLADFNGTQCGFCSPGMVMNMFSLLESKNGQVTMKEVENSFGGNICRCTGYRPILDAFKSFATDADPKLCKDIEDCGTAVCIKSCSGKCSSNLNFKKDVLSFKFEDEREWHKVFNLEQIFKIIESLEDPKYMLVAGNTANGVYRRSPDLKVFVDVSDVEELKSYKLNENSLDLGGNVTLTEAMEIFEKVANENENFFYLREIVKHIDLIANVPVRNNGTLAGNLMIKHANNEFPSDIFIIFEAAGAELIIASSLNENSKISLLEFLKINMDKKLITKITLPSYNPSKFIYRSYKIMPRAQNAHAYVNSAFLIQFDDNQKIYAAKICFGGINPKFEHAAYTESFLIGKNPFNNEVFQSALRILSDEIKPDFNPPDASIEYRKNLALALFYKFILNITPDTKIASKFKSGGEILKRELSSGIQTFDTYEKNWPLTKNISKIEADVQCTGEANYVNDFPAMPHELYAAFVTSKNIGGIIERIDASKALALQGVTAFYSSKDIPGKNTFMPENYLFVVEPEEIFCSSKVLYHGQPVGIILANSFELANKAVEFVEIYYSTSSTFEIKTSLSEVLDDPERTKIFPDYCKEGKFPEKTENPFKKIIGRFEIGGQYHFSMETQSCVCVPIEDGMDVYSATQWMDATQIAIAEAISVSNTLINMHVRRLGGGFGGKISRAAYIATACAIGAFLSRKPVRLVLTLEANMMIIGKRYPCINDYQVEVDKNGKVLKLHNEYVEDYGCSYNEPAYLTTGFFGNCYESQAYNVIAKKAKTDTASNTWCRGPGTLEGISMIENVMEHIARAVDLDPFDVRMVNIPEESVMRKYLEEFADSTHYRNRKQEINQFNTSNRWRKRGIAIVPIKFHVEYFGSLHALVSIYHRDGSVSISTGGIEMGQGLNTKVAQTAAHVLGVPLEMINIKPSNSHTAPNAIVTGGSIGSEISCYAVKKACEILMDRLKALGDNDLNWEQLIKTAYAKDIDLSANYMYKASDLEEYQVYGASCCEMEVDLLTGNILINRVDIMEDVGESMSPNVDIGQIEGGFVMGLGYWLNEKLIYDKNTGELLTNRTWNYKPPGAKDIPIDFRINFLKRSSNRFGVLRSKAVGEPPLCMAIVALFALRHALDSARKDSGIENEEFYLLGAPTTAEEIFLASNIMPEMFLIS